MNENTVLIIGIILLFLAVGVGCAIELKEESSTCAYCQSTISEHADTVICTDGRRYHAECYLRYIEEGENGKANDEMP